MSASKKRLLTGEMVGAIAGLTGSAVAKARHAVEDPLEREPGGYDPRTVGRWIERRALAAAGRNPGDVLDLQHEQAKLARQRRLNLEHEQRIREGRYILKESSDRSHATAGRYVRDAMLTIPGRVAVQVASESDERKCERILTQAIRAELTRLAAELGGAEVPNA